MTAAKKRIYNETCLIPEVIADNVARQYEETRERQEKLQAHLLEKAETVYSANARFARKIRGERGRDLLYAFMAHWAKAHIKRR